MSVYIKKLNFYYGIFRFLRAITAPLHILIYFIYRWIFPTLISLFFSFYYRKKITVFVRQGVTHKIKNFDILFSDLDLGIIASDTASADIAKTYAYFKKKFRFLGELEIYNLSEFLYLKNLDPQWKDLYFSIRKVRQLHWIKNRLNPHDTRHIYHQIKDYRKCKTLKKELGNGEDSWSFILESINKIRHDDFVFLQPSLQLPLSLYCNYLSCPVAFDESNIEKMLLILATLPPKEKGVKQIDQMITNLRASNPELNKIFITLNSIELIIANAYIRGCEQQEAWHTKWLNELDISFTNY